MYIYEHKKVQISNFTYQTVLKHYVIILQVGGISDQTTYLTPDYMKEDIIAFHCIQNYYYGQWSKVHIANSKTTNELNKAYLSVIKINDCPGKHGSCSGEQKRL